MARVQPSPGKLMAQDFNQRSHSVVSVPLNEEPATVEQVHEGAEAKYIRREIQRRECIIFVPDEKESEGNRTALNRGSTARVSGTDKTELPPLRARKTGFQLEGNLLKAADYQTVVGTAEWAITASHRPHKKNAEGSKCQCGYSLSEHCSPDEAEKNGRKDGGRDWDHKTHTSPVPTNAFGEIEFVGFGDKVAKYVRVDSETEMTVMKTLMTQKWGMEAPNLLISVTGGAKNFELRGKLKVAFRRGLMKAALSTGAWIITGGTNAGVMKHVGEAVRDYGLTAEGRVIAIGVAPWGCVQNREVLVGENGKWPAQYRIQGEPKSRQSFLDNNHTHFFLVDNGTQLRFATEIEFRAKLEYEISQWTTNTGSVRVPVALLVLEGGPGTLRTVMEAIENNTPAIMIKTGTGMCGDILAYAAQNITEVKILAKDSSGKDVEDTTYQLDQKVKDELSTMLGAAFNKKEEKSWLDWVEKSVLRPHLISVYELDATKGTNNSDVDVAILKALLKANKDQVMDQLKLALAWNRIDIAKSEIFTDDRRWSTGMLDDMMMSAIQLNRVDFVDLFLDNGVSLKDFLTVRRLLKLYNEIPKNCLLHTLLTKAKSHHRKKFSLEDVGTLIQDLMGDYFQPEYLQDKFKHLDVDEILTNEKKTTESHHLTEGEVSAEVLTGTTRLPRPGQDLMLWAVLMNQQDLAKLFWREGNESTAAALVANSLLKGMKEFTDDTDMGLRLQENANEFESLAIGVINDCYKHDERRAQHLLIREMKHWGNATCVLIAVQADNKRFISQTACQSLLNTIWMGKMSQDNNLLKLIVSMLIFPLIFAIIKFKDEEQAAVDMYNPGKNKKAVTRPVLKREPTKLLLSRENTLAAINLRKKKKADKEEKNDKNNLNESGPLEVQREEKEKKGLRTAQKLYSFYTAPVVIFILNCLSYLIFLGLFSYILVVQLGREYHISEGILIVWVFTIFLEEVRQLSTNYAHSLRSKIVTYITDSWNRLDIITVFLFFVGMVLRFVNNDSCFEAARIVLSVNLITFFFRILHIFSVNKELGPKLVMIREMIRNLMWFVVILMVFIVAYAIASEAILYPQTELSWKLLFYLPRKAYWHIFGELFLDDIEGPDNCTNDPTKYSDYSEKRCPSDIGRYLVPVMMGFYVLMTNVLLLNLLIAMFSYTFQLVQDNTDIHWNFQRFNLIMEYYQRPWLPPPLIIFIHLFMIVRSCLQCWLCRCCAIDWPSDQSSDFRKRFENQQDEKSLVRWENIIADTYLTRVEASEAHSVEGQVKVMMHRVEQLSTKIDDLIESQGHYPVSAPSATSQEVVPVPSPGQQPIKHIIQMPPQLESQLTSLQQQMGSTFKAISWVVQAMEASGMKCDLALPPMESQAKVDKDAEKRKQEALLRRKQVSETLQSKLHLHVVSRSPIYPNSFICRYPVPDEYVSWKVEFSDYDPVQYTADVILQCPPYADKIDLCGRPVKEREGLISFNAFDKDCGISRKSYLGNYAIVGGLPLNPVGRTGLEGRGMLGRWGPNLAYDALVTRWKHDLQGKRVVTDGRPVLEFIAIKRDDNKLWAIPGTIIAGGENASEASDVLTKHFTMEALGSLMDDPHKKSSIDEKLKKLFQKGKTLYEGYADDARNTDNAWLETRVVNCHDETGEILKNFELRAGTGTLAVSWLNVSSRMALHGSHSFFIKLAAEEHRAAF